VNVNVNMNVNMNVDADADVKEKMLWITTEKKKDSQLWLLSS